MRLTVAAKGYDASEYPDQIQKVELSEEDALLPPAKQDVRARNMVFDDVYHTKKESISAHVQDCLDTLTREVDAHQKAATDALDNMLFKERTLILIAIIATLITMLLTTLLVISPLLRAVVYIRAEQPIPIRGSNEFQFLAKTYNLMYEANQEKTERLTYEATHDQLTGLHNRSGYVFFLNNTDWVNSALLLFDMDKFKQINDSGGHELGDKALVKVAQTIRGSFRNQDHVCRIGGDEFAVIMVHTDASHQELVKSKVNQINETLGRGEDGLPPISLSCGVAYGDKTQNTQTIFQRADAALYAVKAAGAGTAAGSESRVRLYNDKVTDPAVAAYSAAAKANIPCSAANAKSVSLVLQLSLRLRSNSRRGTGPPSRQPPDRFCLIIFDNPAAKSARKAFFFWKMGFSVRKMPAGSAYTPS